MNNELLNIVEILETNDFKEVNALLQKNWKIISTYIWSYGHPDPKINFQKVVYVVGRFEEKTI